MTFFTWYFHHSLPQMFQILGNFLQFILDYFSVTELSRSLFAPWKKQAPTQTRGFSLQKVIYNLSFGLISRTLGAVVRGLTILIGLTCYVGTFVVGTLTIIFVSVFFPVLLPYYLRYSKSTNQYLETDSLPKVAKTLTSSDLVGFICRRTGVDKSDFSQAIEAFSDSWSDSCKQIATKPMSDESVLRFFYQQNINLQHLFSKYHVDQSDLDNIIWWYGWLKNQKARSTEFWSRENLSSITGIGKQWTYGYTYVLDELSQDLTKLNLSDFPFINREEESARLIESLTRTDQPHVLIHSKPGVGRHALVMGLVKKIQTKQLPQLSNRRILLFESDKFVSASDSRQAPEKLSLLLQEAESAGNVILVIEDFDQLIKLKSGDYDLSKIFEQKLNSKNLQLLVITNTKEYYQTLRNYDQILKFFSVIELSEMSKSQTIKIILARLMGLEAKHNLYFSYHSIKQIVELADNYLTNQLFPEKALDILSETISFCQAKGYQTVSPDWVDEVVSQITKVPVGKIKEQEKDLLLNIEEVLNSQVVEQKEAIEKISKALRRSRTGVKNTHKPIGSFIFLGPTGVGKTYTAKKLSELFFGKETFIRFDMAEYQTSDSLERLIGSSNSHLPGLLTQSILQNPYNLLLLDEFEKAPKQVHNLFLSILDEGSFTSSDGQKIDCRNLIIIATSNAGSEEIRQYLDSKPADELFQNHMIDHILKNNLFSTELLNRFDAIVFYKPLSQIGLVRVVELELQKLKTQVFNSQQIRVNFSQELSNHIIKNGYEKKFGARSIERYIQDTIADNLAMHILKQPDIQEINY